MYNRPPPFRPKPPIEVPFKFRTYTIAVRPDGEMIVLDQDGYIADRASIREIVTTLDKAYPEVYYVYAGKRPKIREYKIGISKEPKARAARLGIELFHLIECLSERQARDVERHMHAKFIENGNYLDGEWFILDDPDVELIKTWVAPWCVFEQCADSYRTVFIDWPKDAKDDPDGDAKR